MPADLALRTRHAAEQVLPALEPVALVPEAAASDLVRTARSDLAQLALELRTVQADADHAEAGVDHDGHDSTDHLLQANIQERVQGRRRELQAELDRVRAEADAWLDAVRGQAATLLVSADPEPEAVLAPEPAPEPEPEPLESASEVLAAPLAEAIEAAVFKAVGQLQLAGPIAVAVDEDEDDGELDGGSFWQNVLYADVVLPLVAVAIVLLILVAWLV